MIKISKPLKTSDQSSFEFVKECLKGDMTFGINFDRFQTNSETGKYLIIEYLLCDEKQFKYKITPFTSHPNRYFYKNKFKWLKLWDATKKIDADLFLVNYSKKNTEFEDQVLLMSVTDIKDSPNEPVKTVDSKMTKEEFSNWLRKINQLGR